MKVKFINDWQYLFSKQALGGRFSAFTFFNVSFMHNVDELVDGFSFVLLGLGVRISK